MITISENSSGNSCKLKTFSCGNRKQSFAHSQSVIMHEKESFKGKAICRDYSKSSYKSKTQSCGNCKTNFANSKAMIIHEKIMQDQTFSCNEKQTLVMLNDAFSCLVTDCECAKILVQLPHENVFNLHEFSDEFSLAHSQ